MKSYILGTISCVADAPDLLALMLSGGSPWLLLAKDGDAIAYFNIVEHGDDVESPAITADISGRHYNEDEAVLEILRALQRRLGGTITCSP